MQHLAKPAMRDTQVMHANITLTNCSSYNCICASKDTCDKCKDGYFNVSNKCFDKCDPYCSTCPNGTTCSMCKPGRYGPSCELVCSSGCIGGSCNKIDGRCSCEEKFTGDKCEYCEPGNYGSLCRMHCSYGCYDVACYQSDGRCSRCVSNLTGDKCDQCDVGRYSISCDKHCSVGCAGRVCHRQDGSCTCLPYFTQTTCDMCVEGKYGYYCNQSCSFGCVDMRCDKIDGHCACSPNFTGYMCTQCIVGRYGYSCDKHCSKGCNSGNCSKYDGTCTCLQEFSGPTCENSQYNKTYTITCNTNCQTCNPTDGGCSSCKDRGMFGFKCNVECSKHCLNQSCSIDGDCNLGCVSNFYSKKCDIPCPDNCAYVVTGSVCSQQNGVCKNGIRNGTISESLSCEIASDSTCQTAGIVGGVAAVVVVGFVLVGVLVYIRSRRNEQPQSSEYETTNVRSNEATDLHVYSGLNEPGNDHSNQGYYNT
ncbi:hypothetical protein DPMN_152495 [Dreissena polymorpha]|uniref:Tenascin-X n=1 Tax=Dreissena polymorpha TaxID=45954 RepID=A0A9D4J8E4_DREPO|nr:hypothetical protein DPMN_152495 [Dreissena polymorpha]